MTLYTPDVEIPTTFNHPDWFRRVAKTRDSDLRTHRIALTYAMLATVLDDILHGPDAVSRQLEQRRSVTWCNANWFHFAAWATVTITRNITHERPPQRIDTLPSSSLRRRLTPAIVHARATSGQRVSRSLSWGQKMVFVSACHTLRHFCNTLNDSGDLTLPADTVKEIRDLSTWDDRGWIDTERHLPMLGRAFTYYRMARDRGLDVGVRARLVLGGNVLIAAVEQEVIDPAVATTVNHIPQQVTADMDTVTAKWVERLRGIPSPITRLNLPFRYVDARRAFYTAWSRMMTDQVFVMTLPTETLRLGRDLPPRHADRPFYPKALRRLTDTDGGTKEANAALAEVAALVNSLDRTIGNGRGSAARDWRRWDERVNWAVTLMRSRQQDETLFWMPYSEEDQRHIVKGKLPRRGGDPTALEVPAPGGPFQLTTTDGGNQP